VRLIKGKLPLREERLELGQRDFMTAVRGPASGVFAQEPEYWQTVHLGGDGWEAGQAEKLRQERELWQSKVGALSGALLPGPVCTVAHAARTVSGGCSAS
jgi:hypothetical protein